MVHIVVRSPAASSASIPVSNSANYHSCLGSKELEYFSEILKGHYISDRCRNVNRVHSQRILQRIYYQCAIFSSPSSSQSSGGNHRCETHTSAKWRYSVVSVLIANLSKFMVGDAFYGRKIIGVRGVYY